MHTKDWSQIGLVEVRHFSGRIDFYPSLEIAVREINRYRNLTLTYGYLKKWYQTHYDGLGYWNTGDDYEFRDENGLIIPIWRIKEVIEAIGAASDHYCWWRWHYPTYYKHYVYRCGSVPGIRKRRWHRGSWLRHPRTKQELRENIFARETDVELREYCVKVRPARASRGREGVPTCWDDIPRHRERNWKKQRKTQWKNNG